MGGMVARVLRLVERARVEGRSLSCLSVLVFVGMLAAESYGQPSPTSTREWEYATFMRQRGPTIEVYTRETGPLLRIAWPSPHEARSLTVNTDGSIEGDPKRYRQAARAFWKAFARTFPKSERCPQETP